MRATIYGLIKGKEIVIIGCAWHLRYRGTKQQVKFVFIMLIKPSE